MITSIELGSLNCYNTVKGRLFDKETRTRKTKTR